MRPYQPYRSDLTARARELRKNMAAPERKLWFEFLRRLPDRWQRQKPLGAYVADFYCSRAQLVVEIDGDSHFAPGAVRSDQAREAALAAMGVRVLRFSNLEVMRCFGSVGERIVEVVEERKGGEGKR